MRALDKRHIFNCRNFHSQGVKDEEKRETFCSFGIFIAFDELSRLNRGIVQRR